MQEVIFRSKRQNGGGKKTNEEDKKRLIRIKIFATFALTMLINLSVAAIPTGKPDVELYMHDALYFEFMPPNMSVYFYEALKILKTETVSLFIPVCMDHLKFVLRVHAPMRTRRRNYG